MAEFFVGVDALLMPVAMMPAIPHDHSEPFPERVIRMDGEDRPYTDLMAWIALATLTHLPATVVPVGFTPSGLPVGIQIVGPYLEDRTTLAVGAAGRTTARRLRRAAGGVSYSLCRANGPELRPRGTVEAPHVVDGVDLAGQRDGVPGVGVAGRHAVTRAGSASHR